MCDPAHQRIHRLDEHAGHHPLVAGPNVRSATQRPSRHDRRGPPCACGHKTRPAARGRLVETRLASGRDPRRGGLAVVRATRSRRGGAESACRPSRQVHAPQPHRRPRCGARRARRGSRPCWESTDRATPPRRRHVRRCGSSWCRRIRHGRRPRPPPSGWPLRVSCARSCWGNLRGTSGRVREPAGGFRETRASARATPLRPTCLDEDAAYFPELGRVTSILRGQPQTRVGNMSNSSYSSHMPVHDALEHRPRPHLCPWWLGLLLANPLRRLIENPEGLLGPYVGPGTRDTQLRARRRSPAPGAAS